MVIILSWKSIYDGLVCCPHFYFSISVFQAMDHVLLDVSGPRSPATNISNETGKKVPEEFKVIRAKDIKNYDFLGPTVVPSPVLPSRSQTNHPAGEAVVRYFRRSETGPEERILDILPSMSALKKNEICEISSGNEQQLFHFKSKKGVNSLRFAKKLGQSSVHYLELNCRPMIVMDSRSVSRDMHGMKIRLELHVL